MMTSMDRIRDQETPLLARQAQHELLDDPVAARVGEDHRKSRRADQDRKDHGGNFDGLQRALPDHANREPAVQGSEEDCTDAPDRR
jgi:hypothetical protein